MKFPKRAFKDLSDLCHGVAFAIVSAILHEDSRVLVFRVNVEALVEVDFVGLVQLHVDFVGILFSGLVGVAVDQNVHRVHDVQIVRVSFVEVLDGRYY